MIPVAPEKRYVLLSEAPLDHLLQVLMDTFSGPVPHTALLAALSLCASGHVQLGKGTWVMVPSTHL